MVTLNRKTVINNAGRIVSTGVFRTRYRIVTDRYAGYQVDYRYWWMPFYLQHGFCNTNTSVEYALRYIDRIKTKTVYEE